MKKQGSGLLFKFGLIFVVFTIVTLITSGATTYLHQIRIYQEQQAQKLREIAGFLSLSLQMDGHDFPMYQKYFMENYDRIEVPMDFSQDDIEESRKKYEEMFITEFPGKRLGDDVAFSELSPEIREAYAVYNHEYYLYLFERAAAEFGLTYAYYIVPTGEELHMCWMLDAAREMREDTGFINLGIDVLEPLEKHRYMWEAWNTGMAPSGYDVYDDSYELGKTYAWYTPLYVNGEKLGLIGTEVGIEDYNHAIAVNTFRQIGTIALILLITAAATLWIIDRYYIVRIRRLSECVGRYAKDKDAAVSRLIRNDGRDELCTLSNQTAEMILELDSYMKSLMETTEELSHTRKRVDAESEFARKDALTGIRNRNAYEEEIRKLSKELQEGNTHFGFAVVDMNFLKRINDTYGHEQGNIAIRKCCNAVCRVFAHSPVFRIGGDEFVVVLKNEDYDRIEELVRKFNKEIEQNPDEPWKQFSAAVGYALFDPSLDNCVENVFSRADKAMYNRKREMKALS